MSTPSVSSQAIVKESKTEAPSPYVFFFGAGAAEGNGKMRDILGGKGAGLAEMTNAGLPVPPGFTIQTEACREYMRGSLSAQVTEQMDLALARLEKLQGQRLGAGDNPLLVSVRSGAKFSMPGMMDTILNLGLNDISVEALAKKSSNSRFAYDSYRRLIQMFGDVVLDIPKNEFEHIFDEAKKKHGAKQDTELTPAALKEVILPTRSSSSTTPAPNSRRIPTASSPWLATPFSGPGITSAPRPTAGSTTSTTGSAPRSMSRPWSMAISTRPAVPA